MSRAADELGCTFPADSCPPPGGHYAVTGTADAFFADFANIFVTRFIGFAGFVTLFRKLNHDEPTVSAVLGVELHDGVGGGGGTREEIEDDGVFDCSDLYCFLK